MLAFERKDEPAEYHYMMKDTMYSTTNYIMLLDGRGTYPPASTPDMDAYVQRFNAGKLHKPDFKAGRKSIREFEKHNGLPF